MKKNKVLTENTIRRFMKLANIENLSENFVQETMPGYAASQTGHGDGSAGEPTVPPQEEGMLPEEEVEVGLEGGGDKKKDVQDLLKLLSKISGIEMDITDEEDGAGEEEVGGDAGDMMGAADALDADGEGEEGEEEDEEDEGGEEEMNEAAEEQQEGEEKEMDESASASEDAMVESIVRRVTARLLEEAQKGKKKMTAKQKMALKKAQKGNKTGKPEDKKAAKPVEEATAATGGGPLLKKGGNKHDVWAGTPDMKLAKGDKGGAGGHKLSPLKSTKKNAV